MWSRAGAVRAGVGDRFEAAERIPSLPFTAVSSATATFEPGEPRSCQAIGGSLWYRYTAPREGRLVASTFGSTGPAAVAVFTGQRLSELDVVACDQHATGDAEVTFPVHPGTSYLFQLTTSGASAALSVSVLGTITRPSVSTSSGQGDGNSSHVSVSPNGRFVAFESSATNLSEVGTDTNGRTDIFVHDRDSRRTTRVSVSSSGEQADGPSSSAAVSDDGDAAFASVASNLVDDDTNGSEDGFVHDLQTGRTSRVSVSSSGTQGHRAASSGSGRYHYEFPAVSMSPDGRYVAFSSELEGLVEGDTNACVLASESRLAPQPVEETLREEGSVAACRDMFVHDRLTSTTSRVSVSSSGAQAEGDSYGGQISAGGRYVAFGSTAPNLVPGDTNLVDDAFLHDRSTGLTTRVSVSSAGEQGNRRSGTGGRRGHVTVSDDGSRVAFMSSADNLVPGDLNGVEDAFVHDLRTRTTVAASVSSSGQILLGGGHHSFISGDGRFVAFVTRRPRSATDSKAKSVDEVLVHDLATRATRLAVHLIDGSRPDHHNQEPELTRNGSSIAFQSFASNLVADDTNVARDVFVYDFGPSWPDGGHDALADVSAEDPIGRQSDEKGREEGGAADGDDSTAAVSGAPGGDGATGTEPVPGAEPAPAPSPVAASHPTPSPGVHTTPAPGASASPSASPAGASANSAGHTATNVAVPANVAGHAAGNAPSAASQGATAGRVEPHAGVAARRSSERSAELAVVRHGGDEETLLASGRPALPDRLLPLTAGAGAMVAAALVAARSSRCPSRSSRDLRPAPAAHTRGGHFRESTTPAHRSRRREVERPSPGAGGRL